MGRASRNRRGRLHYIRLATSAEWLIVVDDATIRQVKLGLCRRRQQFRYQRDNEGVRPLEPLSSAGCWGHFIYISSHNRSGTEQKLSTVWSST
jgi:hypothetical protein